VKFLDKIYFLSVISTKISFFWDKIHQFLDLTNLEMLLKFDRYVQINVFFLCGISHKCKNSQNEKKEKEKREGNILLHIP